MKVRLLAVGLWCVLLAAAAASQPAPARERPGSWEDPELARIATDIYLLHGINDFQFSPQQIRKLIPVLERVMHDALRLREDVKQKLLEERRRLILGQEPPTPPEAVKRMIRAEAERLRDRARQAVESTRAFLSPEQVQKLRNLVDAKPPGFFGRAGRTPGRRAGPGLQRPPAITRPEPGPSILALQRVTELLKEKLTAGGG